MVETLSEIVIVNEERDEGSAGAVSVYRTANDACAALEHWWVENGGGFAFTATGERLTLGVYGDAVIIFDRQADPHGPEIVHGWLSAHAAAVLEGRRAKARKGRLTLSALEEKGLLPTSIEALIGYVGFED